MKSREPLWLPYILGEQNSIDITTNDVKSLRNPIVLRLSTFNIVQAHRWHGTRRQ